MKKKTTRRPIRLGKLKNNDQIMHEQIKEKILEEVPTKPTGDVADYVPHQNIIRLSDYKLSRPCWEFFKTVQKKKKQNKKKTQCFRLPEKDIETALEWTDGWSINQF